MAKIKLNLVLLMFSAVCKKFPLYGRKFANYSVMAACCLYAAAVFSACGGAGGGFSQPDKLPANACNVTALNTAKKQINARTLQLLQNSGNDLTWLLEWYDHNNRKCSKSFPFNTESFDIVLQNGNARPVLLYLLVNGKKYFYPAGAVFPNMAQPDEGSAGKTLKLKLDFVNGVCADVFADILQKNAAGSAEAENYCNYFNWQKLAEGIAKKKNPSFTDRIKIAQSICSGSFSASSIKELKTFNASLAPESPVSWLICKDLQKAPLVSSNSLEILAENADYLSDKGFVFLQRLDEGSGLVITGKF